MKLTWVFLKQKRRVNSNLPLFINEYQETNGKVYFG
jgi:hypothetical protein